MTATAEINGVAENQLPDGWRLETLAEVCKQDRQIVEPSSELAEKLQYISLEHVESNTGRILRQPADRVEDEGKSMTFAFDSRHVLYGKLRPYLNKVALPEFPGRCTTEIIPLLPNEDVDREFLCWLMRRNETVEAAMREKTGSRMPRADMDELMKLEIPLPPLAEQKRIAGILKEQMAAVDWARASAEAQLQAAENLPAAHLRAVFESDEAQSWPRMRMGDITAESLIGLVRSTTEQSPSARYPYLKMENITTDGRLVFRTTARVDATDEEKKRYTLRKGDFLFNTRNSFELVGKTGIFDLDEDHWVFNNNIMRVRFNPDINSFFILMAFHSDEVAEQMESLKSNTTSVCAIYDRQFVELKIPVPPLEVQHRIASQLSAQMSSAERLRQTLTEQLDAINQLPAALLRRAFNGEL